MSHDSNESSNLDGSIDSQDLMPRSNQDIKLALSPQKLKFKQFKVLLYQNLHSQFYRQWQMMILMIILVF